MDFCQITSLVICPHLEDDHLQFMWLVQVSWHMLLFLLRTCSSSNARKWKAMPSKKTWLWYCGQTNKVKSELFPNEHFTKAVRSLSLWCWDNTKQVPSYGEKRCCKSDCYEVSKYSVSRPRSSIWWREEPLQQDKVSYSSEWMSALIKPVRNAQRCCSAAEWLQEALQNSCKEAGCSSRKFWLFGAALWSRLKAISSGLAAVERTHKNAVSAAK